MIKLVIEQIMRKALLKYLRDHSILMAEGKQDSICYMVHEQIGHSGLTLADAADYSSFMFRKLFKDFEGCQRYFSKAEI